MQPSFVPQVLSVNVGQPRAVVWKGRMVATGIFKEPVAGRIAVRRLNLEGDRQADLTVHGGPEKAIYAYSAEYYPFWRKQLPEMEIPWGMFGENLTVAGLLDETVHIGDRFEVGQVFEVAEADVLGHEPVGVGPPRQVDEALVVEEHRVVGVLLLAEAFAQVVFAFEAGVDHVCLQTVGVNGVPRAEWTELATALGVGV